MGNCIGPSPLLVDGGMTLKNFALLGLFLLSTIFFSGCKHKNDTQNIPGNTNPPAESSVEDTSDNTEQTELEQIGDAITKEVLATFTQDKVIDMIGNEIHIIAETITGMDFVGLEAERMVEELLLVLRSKILNKIADNKPPVETPIKPIDITNTLVK